MLWFKSLEEKIAGLRARKDALLRIPTINTDSYYLDELLDVSQRLAELECRRARKYTLAPWNDQQTHLKSVK